VLVKQTTNRSIGTVLFFILLWVAVVFIDRMVIGSSYAHTIHDVETGWFGEMLNWRTGDPRLVWYVPAASPRILTGITSLFIDVDMTAKPIIDFIRIGIVIQGVFVVICAIWYSWITNKLRMDWLARGALVVLFFSFPVLLMYAGHRGYYFELWIMGLPLGLSLYAFLKGIPEGETFAGAGCGFLTANYYPSVLVVLMFVFVVVGLRIVNKGGSIVDKSILPRTRLEYYLSIWLGLCAGAWMIGAYYSEILDNNPGTRMLIILVIGALSWFICLYGSCIFTRWEPTMKRYFLWLIGGFVVSSLVLLPWYWHGYFHLSSQSIGMWESIVRMWSLTITNPWYLLVWFFLACLIATLFNQIRLIWKGKMFPDYQIGSVIFSGIGTVGVILFAGATATESFIPGGPERGLTAMAPMFAVGTVVISESIKGRWKFLFVVPMVAISAYAVFDYYGAYTASIEKQKFAGGIVDEAIETFFSDQPRGSVVCVAEEFGSKYCAAAYAYNRYRTSRSNDKLPSRTLFNGRVLSLNSSMPDRLGNWDDSNRAIKALLFPVNNPLLIVMEGGWFRDNLIEQFSLQALDITPFWRWWSVAIKNAPEVLYGNYVRSYPDLLAAYKGQAGAQWKPRWSFLDKRQTIEQWGRLHYEAFGKAEGRTLFSTSVAGRVVPGGTLIVGLDSTK
jgi:hypothetical protein